MVEISDQVVDLVRHIEHALAIVRDRMYQQKLGITLTQADILLIMVTEKRVMAGGTLELLVPITASATRTNVATQTFEFSLIPPRGALSLGSSESNALATAIMDFAEAFNKIATRSSAIFTLANGNVTIDMATTTAGELQVIAGGGYDKSTTHTIKLMFRKS